MLIRVSENKNNRDASLKIHIEAPRKAIMITSETIAKAAGVSRTVVSVVLSGKAKQRRIADATVKKVLATAKEMGYSPNVAAQCLRSGKTATVGILMPIPRGDLYSTLIEGLSEAFAAKDYFPSFAFWKDEKGQKLAAATILKRRPEGIVTVEPALLPDRPSVPAVALFTKDERFDCVTFDRIDVMKKTIEYLRTLGHKKIANPFFVPDDPQEEFRQVAIFCKEELLRSGASTEYLSNEAAGKYQKDMLLEQAGIITDKIAGMPAAKRPTAMILYRDMLAAHLINAMREKGIGVPEDISIISCDDSLFAAAMTPALTNFGDSDEQPLAKILAERLFFRMEMPDVPPDTIKIKRKLVKRQSCRALN